MKGLFFCVLLIALLKAKHNFIESNDLNYTNLTAKVNNTCLSGQYMLGIDIQMSLDNKTILNTTVKCGDCYTGCIKCKNSTKIGCRQCNGTKVLHNGDCLDACPNCTKFLKHGVCIDIKCFQNKSSMFEINQDVKDSFYQENMQNFDSKIRKFQNLVENKNKKSLKKNNIKAKTQGVVSTWKTNNWNPVFETTAYMVPSSFFSFGCKLFQSCDFFNEELNTYQGVTNVISSILDPLKELPDVGVFFTAIGDVLDAMDTLLANIGNAMGVSCKLAAVFTIPCKLMNAFSMVIRILNWIVLPILIAIDNSASFLEGKSKVLPTQLLQLFTNVENIFDPFTNFILDFPSIPDISVFNSVFSTLDSIYSSLDSAATTIADIIDGSYGGCVGWWIFSVCYSIDGTDILNGLDGVYETLFQWVLDDIDNSMSALTSSIIDPVMASLSSINFPEINFPDPTNFIGYIQTVFVLAGQQGDLMAMPGQTIGMWEAIPFSLVIYGDGVCMRNDYTLAASQLVLANTLAQENPISNCNYAWSVSWIDNTNFYIINMGMQAPLCYSDNQTPIIGNPGCSSSDSSFSAQPAKNRLYVEANGVGTYLDFKIGPNTIIPDGSLTNVLSNYLVLLASYVRLQTYFNTYLQFNGILPNAQTAGQSSNINDYTTLFSLVLQPNKKVYICQAGIWSYSLLNCNSDGSVSVLLLTQSAPTALFTMIFSSDHQHVTFMASNGLYFSAQPNGIFQCNRQVASIWETFTMITDQFLVHIV